MTHMTSVKFWRIAVLTGTTGATLLASGYAHAEWVMGTVQQSNTYFTEIVASFTVPNPPTSGTTQAQTSIWPGLENSEADLMQTPLGYNQDNVTGWTMHNEVATNSGGFIDPAISVSAGDVILMVIYLDQNNMGSCNLNTGTNCNYRSAWEDLSANNTVYYSSRDWTMATGPTFAMGPVVEGLGPYNTCSDLPVGGMRVYSLLYQFASTSNIYSQVSANYTVETAGSSFPFQFGNVPLNQGGNVFPNCMNISFSDSNGEGEATLFLNSF
jgi:hypothetical protein